MVGTDGRAGVALAQVEVDGGGPGVEAGVGELFAQRHDLVLVEVGDPRRASDLGAGSGARGPARPPGGSAGAT